jgi:hypothetical protein
LGFNLQASLPRTLPPAFAMATNSGRASRAESRASHRSHPYGDRNLSLAPAATLAERPASAASTMEPTDPNLFVLRDLFEQALPGLNMDPGTFPPLTEQILREFSSGEAFLIPLLCKALEGLTAMNARLAHLEEGATLLPPTQPSPPLPEPAPQVPNASLAALEASVRDLSTRMTANASAAAPRNAPPVPSNTRPQPQRQAPQAAPPQQTNYTTNARDPDFPTYDTSLHQWFGDPAAYAIKYPRSWEAEQHREGKYDLSSFHPGTSHPTHKKTLSRPPPSTYASVAAQPETGKGKSKKGKDKATAAQVAASSSAAPQSKGPAPLPLAERRFFAPRINPSPHADALRIAATAPDIAASVLQEANCPHPFAFSATVNDRGSLTLLAKNVYTPATAYAPYYEALANRFNQAFPVGESPFRPFRPAPNEVQLIIHGLPIRFLPTDPQELTTSLLSSIRNAADVTIFTARYLQPDPAKRATKRSTSAIVTVSPADVDKIGKSITLFSKPRNVERAHSSNRFMQCKRCWQYGHSAPACKSTHNICPLCSNNHPRSAHRCPNPTCPKEGNIKAVPACCPASVLRCPNCSGPHTATHHTCPSKPAQEPAARPPQDQSAQGDQMETADDLPAVPATPGPQTPPSAPAVEEETPRPSLPPPHAFFQRSSSAGPSNLFGSNTLSTPTNRPFGGPFLAPQPKPVAPLARWSGELASSSPDILGK